MSGDGGGGEGALELAARRLERATAQLEQRLAQKIAAASAGAGAAFDEDRARLAAALDAARARERELEEAGAAASAALARAIAQMRDTLGESAPDAGEA
jgi:DNA anti-recombination protein RmuC